MLNLYKSRRARNYRWPRPSACAWVGEGSRPVELLIQANTPPHAEDPVYLAGVVVVLGCLQSPPPRILSTGPVFKLVVSVSEFYYAMV